MYAPPEPPFYFWLATVPLYGTPLFVTLWAVRKFRIAGERGKAAKGLAAWLVLTIAFFAAGFVLEPCLENCSQYRTPEGNTRAFALILTYTALAALIVFRLHRYGKPPALSCSLPP